MINPVDPSKKPISPLSGSKIPALKRLISKTIGSMIKPTADSTPKVDTLDQPLSDEGLERIKEILRKKGSHLADRSTVSSQSNLSNLLSSEAHRAGNRSFNKYLGQIEVIMNNNFNPDVADYDSQGHQEYKNKIRGVETTLDALNLLVELRTKFNIDTPIQDSYQTRTYNGMTVQYSSNIDPANDGISAKANVSSSNNSSINNDIISRSKNNEPAFVPLKELFNSIFSQGAYVINEESPIQLVSSTGYAGKINEFRLDFKFQDSSGLDHNIRIDLGDKVINSLIIDGNNHSCYVQPKGAIKEFLQTIITQGFNTKELSFGYRSVGECELTFLEEYINKLVDEKNSAKNVLTGEEPVENYKLGAASPDNTNALITKDEAQLIVSSDPANSNLIPKIKLTDKNFHLSNAGLEKQKLEADLIDEHKMNLYDVKSKSNIDSEDINLNTSFIPNLTTQRSIASKVSKNHNRISGLNPTEIMNLRFINSRPVEMIEKSMYPSFRSLTDNKLLAKKGVEVCSNFSMVRGGGNADSGFLGLTENLLPVIAAQKALMDELNISVDDYANLIDGALNSNFIEDADTGQRKYVVNDKVFSGDYNSYRSSVPSPFRDGHSSNETKKLIPDEAEDQSIVLSGLHVSMIKNYGFSESTDGLRPNAYAIFPKALKTLGLTDKSTTELNKRYQELKSGFADKYLENKKGQLKAVKALKIFKTDLFQTYFLTNLDKPKSKEEFLKILNNVARDDDTFKELLDELNTLEQADKDWYALCENYSINTQLELNKNEVRRFLRRRM